MNGSPVLTPVWEIEPGLERPLLVHVNSTATGGGVSELLRGLARRQRAGWAVIGGEPGFYAMTKYLHHLLHGKGDPARLDDPALMRTYRATLAPQTEWFARRVTAGDVVVLHDPQTLGLAAALKSTGATVIWHCHIGADVDPETGPAAVWRAFAADVAAVDTVVTTLPAFAPPAARHVAIVAPAVDPTATKNKDLTRVEVDTVLSSIGLTADRVSPGVAVEQERLLPSDAPVVLQVSRWDRLKDMPGVVRCLAGLPADAHLVLAGTDPTEIPDDPEGLAVLAEVRGALTALSAACRARVHLVTISMKDAEFNALVVNALQRRADVVVQKSLREGFGLTVTEAMIKGRAVVASDVGGLRLQITDGTHGLLVDPTNLPAVCAALTRLLQDPALRAELGERARTEALERFTMHRFADDYARVVARAR